MKNNKSQKLWNFIKYLLYLSNDFCVYFTS